jgi:hypothetical protein
MSRKYGPRRPEFYKYYSVYDRKTDTPVFIHGTARECAKAMGVTRNSFYCYMTRNRRGEPCRYDIYVDDKEDEEDG